MPAMVSRSALLLLGTLSVWAQSPAGSPAPLSRDSESILLQVLLANTPVGDGITAFPTPAGALVPLGELCQLLGLGIRIEPGGQKASGFFISEKRHFRLDLARAMVEVEGRTLPLAPLEAQALGGEIFVEAKLLQLWFPLEAKLSTKASLLALETKEKLPVQLAWERERAMQGQQPAGKGAAPRLPLAATPYGALDWPMVDLNAGWNTSQHQPTQVPQGTMVLSGDALWMSAQAVLVRDAQARNRLARTTLFREDPDGGLLGPMRARRVLLGDVAQSPVLDLAGPLASGRGLLVENYPTAYRSTFAGRTFRGNLPQGWSAELYQNGALVGMVRSRPDGLYEFPNVPMRFGLNVFKLVFHGPLGERREELYRLDISQDMPPAGTFYYRAASLKPSERFNLEQGEQRSSLLEGDYGLSNTLAVKGAWSQVSRPEGMHAYSVLGFRGVFSFLAGELYASSDRPATGGPTGAATQAVLRSGWGFSTLSLSHSEYRRGFLKTSGLGSGGLLGILRSETSLDLYHSFSVASVPLGATFSRTLQDLANYGRITRDTLQVSANLPRLNISQTLVRASNPTRGDQATPLETNLLLSSFNETTTLQAELGSTLGAGATRLRNWGGGLEYRTQDGALLRAYLKGLDTKLRNAVASVGINMATGRFAYGLDLQFSRSMGYSVGLRIGTSLGREPRGHRWTADAQPMGGQGALSAQGFLDLNGNGIKEPGERPLEELSYKVGNTTLVNRSKDAATAFYLNTGRAQIQEVRMDASSLEDPSQVPAQAGLGFVPRPGKVAKLDFPVIILGEVTSTTRVRRNGRTEPLGGVEVELLDGRGQRVKVLRSSFDGFFEIRDLPLGQYTLQVTAVEALRLNLAKAPSRIFLIDMAHPFQNGLDLILEAPTP